ncbi:hypothetical protein QFZ22_005138 [Streptomyces canus]|uniref:Esterase n=1 Tax=Streptomyces canus TaxID=58343 RepID=A0AAW8FI10_9ACTN|nr:FG-GAP repeat protein [Streptomyces canus]MDQ0909153.1 hypothetical protein [Streptomyces canus]
MTVVALLPATPAAAVHGGVPGDFNKDGRPELFVGAAGENNFTGAVSVFPGGSTRPTATGSKMFTAASVGLISGATAWSWAATDCSG